MAGSGADRRGWCARTVVRLAARGAWRLMGPVLFSIIVLPALQNAFVQSLAYTFVVSRCLFLMRNALDGPENNGGKRVLPLLASHAACMWSLPSRRRLMCSLRGSSCFIINQTSILKTEERHCAENGANQLRLVCENLDNTSVSANTP
jgi:hypothetical protein